MNSRFVIAALAGAVVLFLVGFLLYGLALMGFYESGTMAGVMKETPNFLWLGLGQVAGGFLLATVLGWAGAKTSAAGLKKGAIFGLLVALTLDLSIYGTSNINNLTVTLVDPIFSAIHVGIAGSVVGMMLGRGEAA